MRDPFASFAVAVGQDEEPPSPLGRSDISRREQIPLRIEPEVGQVSEDVSESPSNESWNVLQEDEARSRIANDPGDGRPYPPIVFEPSASAGVGPGLAGEPRSDEIHRSTPRSAVEGLEVVPDRSRIQGLVLHPRHEDGRGEGFPLDVAHSPCGGLGEPDAELEPSDPGADGEGT